MSEAFTSPTDNQNTDPDINVIYNRHTDPDTNGAPYNPPAATAPGAYPHPVPVGLVPPSTAPNSIKNNFGGTGAGYNATTAPSAPTGTAPLSPNTDVMPMPMPMPVPTPTHARRETELNSNQMNQLIQQGFTEGMATALSKNCSDFPLRIWIVDNSGSMNIADGQRIVATASSTQVKSAPCTRWKEIQETVEYHIQMSGLLKAPTIFRFLNHPDGAFPQEFSVADKGDSDTQIADDVSEALRIIRGTSPTGATPLTFHVREIHQMVQGIQPSLRAEGKRVAVILATDGLPSNNLGVSGESELREFTDAMRLLEGLPIWIVVRLCTDNDEIVEFYNNLDNNLELSIEVLDNYTSEADEMHQANSWLNYCLALHRMRELGFQHRIFDLLDERSLTISELREFFLLMFGVGKFDGVPEPELDFKGFMTSLDRIVKSEKEQWHPVKRKLKPLVSMTKLKAEYGRGGAGGDCTIM